MDFRYLYKSYFQKKLILVARIYIRRVASSNILNVQFTFSVLGEWKRLLMMSAYYSDVFQHKNMWKFFEIHKFRQKTTSLSHISQEFLNEVNINPDFFKMMIRSNYPWVKLMQNDLNGKCLKSRGRINSTNITWKLYAAYWYNMHTRWCWTISPRFQALVPQNSWQYICTHYQIHSKALAAIYMDPCLNIVLTVVITMVLEIEKSIILGYFLHFAIMWVQNI